MTWSPAWIARSDRVVVGQASGSRGVAGAGVEQVEALAGRAIPQLTRPGGGGRMKARDLAKGGRLGMGRRDVRARPPLLSGTSKKVEQRAAWRHMHAAHGSLSPVLLCLPISRGPGALWHSLRPCGHPAPLIGPSASRCPVRSAGNVAGERLCRSYDVPLGRGPRLILPT